MRFEQKTAKLILENSAETKPQAEKNDGHTGRQRGMPVFWK
ncbi:hypothetical protein BRYFOR_06717 [Marvinbryantia formatexigens DSM 14469]|uniref:Uncharacterized protein n=1 Tax=Marvinbryantia formatexigens DSM 14469 TaxID=478749 RepID=C6LDL9_9FIRM|nr:hypothetical protein BRYFOR_06717 [Marvinbryantia formatexigens DSM 14469]